MAARKRDVRLTDANAIKQISTALTSVTAVIVETFVRTAAVQMMILMKTRMLHMKVTIAVEGTVVFQFSKARVFK